MVPNYKYGGYDSLRYRILMRATGEEVNAPTDGKIWLAINISDDPHAVVAAAAYAASVRLDNPALAEDLNDIVSHIIQP